MPLDARKALHIIQATTRSFAGRQRTVVLVSRTSSGYTYTTLQAILRTRHAADSRLSPPNQSNDTYHTNPDSWLIAPSGTNFSGVVYIADTSTASSSAVAAATKYELLEVLTPGLAPGGSHVRVALRLMH